MSVIFVCGGAGTGKTMLLSTFLHETALKNVRWLTLDSSNTDVGSFWYYFTAAVEPFLQSSGDLLEIMQAAPEISHMKSILTVLINQLYTDRACYLVLDDIHTIKSPALLHTFEFFINNMPENLHLFMLSREGPPIYLGPLAVSGRLLFLDSRQMLLSQEESLSFLKQTLHLNGSDSTLEKICDYAEGWVGGLQMAAAANAAGVDSKRLLQADGGIAAEYLTREIVEALSPKEQDFLQGTAFLPYFDANICSILFDGFSKKYFSQMIENLIRKNLLLICLDKANGIYRYHNILADYLLQRFSALPEEKKRAMRRKSARIFEKRGDHTEAMREFCEAGNYTSAMALAREGNGGSEICGCLEKIPTDILASDVDLSIQCLQYDYYTANLERCRKLFRKLQELYDGTPAFDAMQSVEYYFFEGKSRLPSYSILTKEQIDALHLSPTAKSLMITECAVGFMEHRCYADSEAAFQLAANICHSTNTLVESLAIDELAQLYEETGQFQKGLACYANSRRKIHEQKDSLEWFHYCIGIAGIYMRRMELDRAAAALQEAKPALQQQEPMVTMTYCYHRIELDFLHGNLEKGKAGVFALREKFPNYSLLSLGRLLYYMACTANFPSRMAEQILQKIGNAKEYVNKSFLLILQTRVLISLGKAAETSRNIDDILVSFRENRNLLRLTEADLLKIHVLENGKPTVQNTKMVRNLLCEAISSAAENRIVQPFFLERKILFPLLQNLESQNRKNAILGSPDTAFLYDLIALCGHQPSSQSGPDALTARETEVLQNLALGLTNREIAEKLCISQATVKTHVLSIFGKLEVSSRLMAVEKARGMKLLS